MLGATSTICVNRVNLLVCSNWCGLRPSLKLALHRRRLSLTVSKLKSPRGLVISSDTLRRELRLSGRIRPR